MISHADHSIYRNNCYCCFKVYDFFFKSLSKATIVYFVCILSDTFLKKMINVNFVFKTAFALKTITLQKNDYTISFDAIYFFLLVPALLFD